MGIVNLVVADDDYYIYDDELYAGGTLTWKTLATPPIIIDPPSRGSSLGRRLKIIPQKQQLQGLPILLAKVQAGKSSENLLKETREIVYSLY